MGTQDIGVAESGVKLGISPTYLYFSKAEKIVISVSYLQN